MEAARPRTRGRRLRRGTVERPLNSRLVRVGFLVVIPALLAFVFSFSTTGALPRSPLEPIFDAESAKSFAETLSVQFPSRVPGSDGAADAALWYRETISALGLPTEEDVWSEELADLGTVELRNVVTVVAGRSEETIVLVAHRDNAGVEEPLGENAAGIGALIELARGFAPQEIGPDPLPEHTLVLVSTDAGAYGGAGAARFAGTSPLASRAIAVVVLDGLGRGTPHVAIAGDDPVSPARALVRTAAARVSEETRVDTMLPSVADQLVALGVPFALEEQGRFLGHGLSAVTIGTRGAQGRAVVDGARLGQFGRATEALVGSLDASVGRAFRTPDSLFFVDRTASGWTLRLVLVLAIVPFALGVVDLVVRGRRRGLPFGPARRALRMRIAFWGLAGVLIWLGGVVGAFPSGAPLPLAPYPSVVTGRPLLALLTIGVILLLAWLIVIREPLAPIRTPGADERLAGLIIALALLGCIAVALAFAQPYAILFVLPSLYAWLWLPLEGHPALRATAFAAGLLGPAAALVVLSNRLELSVLDGAVYVVGLATVGYLSPLVVVSILAWSAVAAQVGALSFGRYGAYKDGAEPSSRRRLGRRLERSR